MPSSMAAHRETETAALAPAAPTLCSSLAELVNEAGREQAELALLNRALPMQVSAAFAELDLDHFDDIRLRGPGEEIPGAVGESLKRLPWPSAIIEQMLADAGQIFEASAQWSPNYVFRLECVSDDACRKFHKDRTDIRLITTYHGPGTQWIDAACPDGEPLVNQLALFSIGAFIGQRDHRPQRIFHRSPPMTPELGSRLVMVMDIERPGWNSR